MLAQDSLGYVHEVPDFQVGYGLAEYPDGSVAEVPMALDGYGGYGGYGSPMGLPFLAPIAAALAPMAAGAISRILPGAAQAVGRMVRGIVPGAMNAIRGGMAPLPPMPGMPMPSPMPGMPRPFFRAPHPVGWVTPALPFTGTRPRRMYLRCAAWPGPTGLVPAFANQPLPLPGMPGAPGAPGMPGVPGGRRRRRRGRR